jgi:hypothetical protein
MVELSAPNMREPNKRRAMLLAQLLAIPPDSFDMCMTKNHVTVEGKPDSGAIWYRYAMAFKTHRAVTRDEDQSTDYDGAYDDDRTREKDRS